MINEAKCGTFVPAGDVAALMAEVERYARMSEQERQLIGAQGKAWLLENRQYKKLAEDYLCIMLNRAPQGLTPVVMNDEMPL
jgi:hypothetical protein